jgi:hypothetical protein
MASQVAMLIITYVLTCVNGINKLSIWSIDVATYLQDYSWWMIDIGLKS